MTRIAKNEGARIQSRQRKTSMPNARKFLKPNSGNFKIFALELSSVQIQNLTGLNRNTVNR